MSKKKIIKAKHFDCMDEVYGPWFTCPACSSQIWGGTTPDNYCPACGIKLVWSAEAIAKLNDEGDI